MVIHILYDHFRLLTTPYYSLNIDCGSYKHVVFVLTMALFDSDTTVKITGT
jgi:hypothetical protein